MKYSIDRIENNIAIIEDLNTKEIKEIDIKLLPDNIKEGNILIYDNNKYILDEDTEKARRREMLSKFAKLKKK